MAKLFSKKGLIITVCVLVGLAVLSVILNLTGVLDAYKNATIKISSAEEFYEYWQKGFPSTRINQNVHQTYKDKYVLTADIDLSGYDSVQNYESQNAVLDDGEYNFGGRSYFNFDGKNHTIKNLNIHGSIFASLFGCVDKKSEITVKNLVIENVNVTGNQYAGVLFGKTRDGANVEINNVTIKNSTVASSGTKYIGGLIGELGSGVQTIKNCKVENTQIGSENANYVGGLVGKVNGNHGDIAIFSDCSNINGEVIGKERVGGIVGELNHTYEDYKKDRLLEYKNLTNSSDVVGTKEVGGIVGFLSHWDYANFTFTNCKNLSSSADDVSGIVASEKCAGGILGSTDWNGSAFRVPSGSQLNFVGCSNSAGVSSPENAGGISGFLSDKFWKVSHTDCTNNGDIEGTTYVAGISARFLGNIAGAEIFTFTNCTNTGNVTGKDYVAGISAHNKNLAKTISFKNCKNLSETAKITGCTYVAGINSIYGTYKDCENSMDISYNSAYVLNAQYFGGIVAKGTDSEFDTCKNSGNIFDYSNNPTITANFVGGIAGETQRVVLKTCENSGVVAGSNNVGGFIGNADVKFLSGVLNTITNCKQDGDVYSIGQASTTAQNYEDDEVCGNVGLIIGKWNTGNLSFDISNVTTTADIYMLKDANYVGGWCGRLVEYTPTLKTTTADTPISYKIYQGSNVSQVCKNNFKYGENIFDTSDNLNGFNSPSLVEAM